MKIKECYADNVEFGTVQIHLTVEGMKEPLTLAEKLDSLVGEEVDIKAEKHRNKRSLNANSYFHVLCGKIADAVGSSKDEVHNLMLARYGQYLRDKDGNIVFLLMPETIEYEKESEIHLKPTGKYEERNGMRYAWFAQMKPSHEYNTKEMALLIDGIVSEAKELEIEVLSPEKIKRMEATYGKGIN